MPEQDRAMLAQEFLRQLDAVIAEHSMLKHPFYLAWSNGELTLDILQKYSKQYLQFEQSFPQFVSAVHSRCGNNYEARRLLLDNLVDEERSPDGSTDPWHRELWLQFTDGLGITRDEVLSADLLNSTKYLVKDFFSLTQHNPWFVGVAALYAYESQAPTVARTKREGLEKFFGINDARAIEFFTEHEHADVEHSRREAEILASSCRTLEEQELALHGAEKGAESLEKFLDGVYAEYVTAS